MAEPRSAQNPSSTLEPTLSRLAGRVSRAVPQVQGSIVVRCSDRDEEYRIEGLGRSPRVVKEVAAGQPAVRVTGPTSVIQEVLDGKLEASRAITGGGIRVRGDLKYLESVLKDLGLLDCE